MLGGKSTYSPAFYSTTIFLASIGIGLMAGLITGCIGAGGGFIIAPALMSAGIKGILAVGTDLFHIFAKAIMGSVIHRKLGNVSVPLAAVFLIGAVLGATLGGLINRGLYELNPVISDAFITTIYSIMLGFLGFYALFDFLKARGSLRRPAPQGHHRHHGGKSEGADIGGLPRKIQGVKIPPMVRFDHDLVPAAVRSPGCSWWPAAPWWAWPRASWGRWRVPHLSDFRLRPGRLLHDDGRHDIFQIIFTAGWAAISQYAIYGFIFYTLAMGMLLGSLLGIQIGAMATKVVPGITIRGSTPWRCSPGS